MNNPEYDINDYTDKELFDLLDLTNPSDRILEAKILMMIQKYSELTTQSGRKLTKFFEEVYAHFFESESEEEEEEDEGQDNEYEEGDRNQLKEGFETETKSKEPTMKDILEALNNVVTALNKGNTLASNVTKGNSVVKSTNLEYVKSNINPLLKQTCKRICMFDSQYRDTTLYPISGSYLINLSDPLYNVLSLRLHTINIPFTWYNVSKNYNYNYFTLTSTGPGFDNTYQFRIDISGGSYSMAQLTQALQNSIKTVAAQNPDTNFGNTSIAFSQSTGKMTLTLDLGNIYTTNNYYLDFPTWSNPYNSSRNTTIPGFLGFIPPTSPYVEASSNIILSKIYSNFTYAKNATNNLPNGFENTSATASNPKPPAYSIFNYYTTPDASANNYFTIYNYDGTNGTTYPFDPSGYTIYNTITVPFFINTVLFTPTRQNITSSLNAALQSNPSLDPSSNISQEYFPNYDACGNYMYRYALNIILNRNTTATQKIAGMNQIVVFPAVDATYGSPIWTGPNSCFLFDPNNSLQQLNNVTSQISVSPFWNINSRPYILLKNNKPGYTDNSYNSFITDISNGIYPSNEYLTVYTPPSNLSQAQNAAPTNSIINQALANTENVAKTLNTNITDFNNFIYFNSDASSNKTFGNFSITTEYNTSNFILDLTGSIFYEEWNSPNTINGTNPNSSSIISDTPLWNITNTNNTLAIYPQQMGGTMGIPPLYASIDPLSNLTPTQITQYFSDISLGQWRTDLSGQIFDASYYGINAIDLSINYTTVGSKENTLTINTSPYIDISSITPGYTNKYRANIGNQTPNPSFNSYIGTRYDYSGSIVNTALAQLSASAYRPNHTNNRVNAVIYYDASYSTSPQISYDPSYAYTVGLFDISINYDITDFYLDFTDCSFLTNLGMPPIILGTSARGQPIDISFQVPSTLTYVDYYGQFFTLKGTDPSSNMGISIPATLQNQQSQVDFSMINIINNTLNPAIHLANNPVKFGVDWSNTQFYYEPSGGARSIGSVTITDSPEIKLRCNMPGYNTLGDISNANITIPIDISSGSSVLFTDYLGLLSDNSYTDSSVNTSIQTSFSQIRNPAFSYNINGTALYYDDISGTANYMNTVGIFDFSINYTVSDFYLDLSNSIFHQEWGLPQTISGDTIINVSSQIASALTWSVTTGVNNTITLRPQPTSGTANVPPIDISINALTDVSAGIIINAFNLAIQDASARASIYKINLSGTNVEYDPSGGTQSGGSVTNTDLQTIQLECTVLGYNKANDISNANITIPIDISNNISVLFSEYMGFSINNSGSTINKSILAETGLGQIKNPAFSYNQNGTQLYYDVSQTIGIFDFSINYIVSDFYLDLTNSIFHQEWGLPQTISGDTIINVSSQIASSVTWIITDGVNNTIRVVPKPTSGTANVPPIDISINAVTYASASANAIIDAFNLAIQDASARAAIYRINLSGTNVEYDPSGGAQSGGSVTFTDSPKIQLACTVPGYNGANDISNANITIHINNISSGSTVLFSEYMGFSSDNSGSTINKSIGTGLNEIHSQNPAFSYNQKGTALYYDVSQTVGIFDFSINYNVSDFYLDLTKSIFHREWRFPQTISGDTIIDVSSQIASLVTWNISSNNNTIRVVPKPTRGTANVPPIDISINAVTYASASANAIIDAFNLAIQDASATASIYKINLSETNIGYDSSGGTSSNHITQITTNPQIQLLCNTLSGYDNSYNNILIDISNGSYTYESYIGTLQNYAESTVNMSISAELINTPSLQSGSYANIYYDPSIKQFIGDFSINIQYTGADYYLDLSNSIFKTWGFDSSINGISNIIVDVSDISYNVFASDNIKLYANPDTGAYVPSSNQTIQPFTFTDSSYLSVNDIITAYNTFIFSASDTFNNYGTNNLQFSYDGSSVTLHFDMSINPITSENYTAYFIDSSQISPSPSSWIADFGFTDISYTNLSENTVLSNSYTLLLDYSGIVTTQFYVKPYALTANDYTVTFSGESWNSNFHLDDSPYNLSSNTTIVGSPYSQPYDYSGIVTTQFYVQPYALTANDYIVTFSGESWNSNFHLDDSPYNLSSNTIIVGSLYSQPYDYSGVVTTQFYVQPYALTENDYTITFSDSSSSWQNSFYLDYSYNLSDNAPITSNTTYDPPYDYSGVVTLHYDIVPYSLTAADFCVSFQDISASVDVSSSWSKYFYLNDEPYDLSLNQSIIQSNRSYNALIPAQHVVNISYSISVDPIYINDYTVYFGDYSGNIYDSSSSSWEYFMGLDPSYNLSDYYTPSSNTSIIDSSDNVPLDASSNTITINSSNNTFYLRPQSNIRGLSDISGINDITITLPSGDYTQPQLFDKINTAFGLWSVENINAPYSIPKKPLVLYTDPSTNIQYSQFQFNIGRSYTAKDYILTFFDPSSAVLYQANIGGTCTYTPQVWGIAIGWQIGFHSSPVYYLNPSYSNTPLNTLSPLTTNTQSMTLANSYTYDPLTNIITITGDTVVDLYLYYNFFIVFDDGVMNRLNDGLVTVSDKDQNVDASSYSSASQSKRVLGNVTINNFTNSTTSNNLTQAQFYSASQKSIANTPTTSQYRPTQPTNLSDCFAVLPLKQQGLTIGQTYTDSGGSLQDNNRVYFGPVNVRQANIQLVSDRGEIVDLNGANWSFCVVAEYLYSQAGMENTQN